MTVKLELTSRQLQVITYLISHALETLREGKTVDSLVNDIKNLSEETNIGELKELHDLMGESFFEEMDKG